MGVEVGGLEGGQGSCGAHEKLADGQNMLGAIPREAGLGYEARALLVHVHLGDPLAACPHEHALSRIGRGRTPGRAPAQRGRQAQGRLSPSA